MRRVWQSLYLFGLTPLRSAGPVARVWAARAARGGKRARLVWWAMVLLVGGLLFTALAAAGAWIVHWRLWEYHPDSFETVFDDLGDDEYLWSYVTAWAIAAGITLVALVMLRLMWLRIGAKRALIRRGRCATCGHGLSGIPIGNQDQVRCPECAALTPAVEAWNEIDRSSPDRPVFRPATGLVSVFWTRRRLALSGKLCAALLLLCALGYGGWWGVREMGIRKEAAVARRERPNLDEVNAKILALKPPLQPGQKYAGDAIREILTKYDALVQQFKDTHMAGVEGRERIVVDADWAEQPSHADDSDDWKMNVHYSSKLMTFLQASDLYEDLDRLRATARWQDNALFPIDQPRVGPSALPDLRRALRICTARMRIARGARYAPEFERAGLSAIAIYETSAACPLLINWLIARSIEKAILKEIREVLLADPSREMLHAVDQLVEALPEIDHISPFESEQASMLDAVCWFFSEPSRVRRGMSAPELEEKLGVGKFALEDDPEAAGLGTYTQNREAIDLAAKQYIAAARLAPFERRTQGLSVPDRSELAIPNFYAGVLPIWIGQADEHVLHRRAVRIMVRLEQFRQAELRYPDSLQELLTRNPQLNVLDPFSGKAFGYRLSNARNDRLNRGYVLWSVGADGEDNGGFENRRWDVGLRPAGAGQDVILNDTRW